jgi:hypothetical protein
MMFLDQDDMVSPENVHDFLMMEIDWPDDMGWVLQHGVHDD